MRSLFSCRFRLSIILTVVLQLLTLGTSFSLEMSPLLWTEKKLDTKKRVIEGEINKYPFKHGKYNSGNKVPYINKLQQNYSTPENAAVSYFSALAAGDVNWWRSSWSSASVAKTTLEKLLGRFKLREDKLSEKWKTTFANRDVYLIQRVDYEKYVVVFYKQVRKDKGPDGRGRILPIVLKKMRGEWKNTEDLKAHPLLRYAPWNNGKYDVIKKSSWGLEGIL